MGQEQTLLVVAVPVALHDDGNLAVLIALREDFGVGDILVVGNTAVLSGLLMDERQQGVHLVLVAKVRCVDIGIEVRVVLILEIAAGIEVVEVETEAQTLAEVSREAGVDVVLAVGLVAAVVVGHVGDGRQRVGEVPLVGLGEHLTVGVGECKLRL